LLKAGADINAINKSRNSLLLIATSKKAQLVVVQTLLDNKADIAVKGNNRLTVLHLIA